MVGVRGRGLSWGEAKAQPNSNASQMANPASQVTVAKDNDSIGTQITRKGDIRTTYVLGSIHFSRRPLARKRVLLEKVGKGVRAKNTAEIH